MIFSSEKVCNAIRTIEFEFSRNRVERSGAIMRSEYTVRLGYLAVQILQIEAFSDYMRDCFADEFTWLELGQELDAT